MQAGEFGIAHLDAQIAARHHHHIGNGENTGEIVERLMTFDLGDHARLAAPLAQLTLGATDVITIACEGNRQIVNAELGRQSDVFEVFLRERRRRNAAALAIDAFAVGELTTSRDHTVNT